MRIINQREAPICADRLSAAPTIHPQAYVEETALGRYTEICARSIVLSTAMDDYSYIMNDCEVAGARIGKFCSIASHVRINPGNHPMERASQSHFTYRSELYWPDAERDEAFFAWRASHGVEIGHDVWIGHGAVILPGIRIGTGAVVGAGAVVTKPVGAYTIVTGIPAKPLKRRFPDDIAAAMMRLAWWDWSHEALRLALTDFRTLSAAEFIAKYQASGEPGEG